MTKTTIPVNFPYVDTLFDYATFLRDVEKNGAIAKCTTENTKVAIIGSGAGGIIAGYELLRAGISDLTIYSADDKNERPYGRMNSKPFRHQDKSGRTLIAELGAMRFPVSEIGFFHYMNQMGVNYEDNFPDPGLVTTLLSVNGRSYIWQQGEDPPSMFKTVFNGWNALLKDGVTIDDKTLPAPLEISQDLKAMRIEQASEKWQQLIDTFSHYTFRGALGLIFQEVSTPPGGQKWKDEDMELFGTLGVGSGGFNPLYSISFIEVLRILVNDLETKQQFIPDGADAVLDALASQSFTSKNSHKQYCLKDKIIYLNEPNALIDVQVNDGKYEVSVGSYPPQPYDYVIFALPTWALQTNYRGGINAIKDIKLLANVSSIGEKQCHAILNQHILASTKVFVLTKDKFWLKDPSLYSNIQSDSLTRGFYCLDYNPDNPDGYGVVLLSYTWEDDANKLAAYSNLSDFQKAHRLLDCLERIDGAKPTADAVRTGMLEVETIEWMHTPNYQGAFKLIHVGQDVDTQNLYWDFVKCKNETTDSKIYFAGDGCSFNGGWVEGAVQSGLNSATAILYGMIRNGKAVHMVNYNPVDYSYENTYNYSMNRDDDN